MKKRCDDDVFVFDLADGRECGCDIDQVADVWPLRPAFPALVLVPLRGKLRRFENDYKIPDMPYLLISLLS